MSGAPKLPPPRENSIDQAFEINEAVRSLLEGSKWYRMSIRPWCGLHALMVEDSFGGIRRHYAFTHCEPAESTARYLASAWNARGIPAEVGS